METDAIKIGVKQREKEVATLEKELKALKGKMAKQEKKIEASKKEVHGLKERRHVVNPEMIAHATVNAKAKFEREKTQLVLDLEAKKVLRVATEREKDMYSEALDALQIGGAVEWQAKYEEVKVKRDRRNQRRRGFQSRSHLPSHFEASTSSVKRKPDQIEATEAASTSKMRKTRGTPTLQTIF